MTNEIVKKNILYPELSYKIVGILFNVYNELGFGYREKHYENAIKQSFNDANIKYKQQLHVPLKYRNNKIGDYFLDFLIDDLVVLELKQGNNFSKKNIDQIYEYLKATVLKLGIIAQLTSNGVKCKRIVNIK